MPNPALTDHLHELAADIGRLWRRYPGENTLRTHQRWGKLEPRQGPNPARTELPGRNPCDPTQAKAAHARGKG